MHFVGGLVEGRLPAGGANVSYQAGIGNGRGNVISRAGDAGDNNGRPAWLVTACTSSKVNSRASTTRAKPRARSRAYQPRAAVKLAWGDELSGPCQSTSVAPQRLVLS